MKFYNYLNEEINKKSFEKVVQDCWPYLKELKKSGYNFLLSGRKNVKHDNFIKKKVRKNRKPKDMDPKIQKKLDKAFNELFGVRPRSSSIFTTTKDYTADEYGNVHYVFPVGKYQLMYSEEIKDLFSDFSYYAERLVNVPFWTLFSFFENNPKKVFYPKESYLYTQLGRKELPFSVTPREFNKITKEVVESVVEKYEKTTKIPKNYSGEIMLICDEVRLYYYHHNEKNNMIKMINNYL